MKKLLLSLILILFLSVSTYGMDFLELRPAGDVDKAWLSCSISGSYIIAGAYNDRLYTSANYGVNWTERQPAGAVNKNWYSCYVDGAYMIAVNMERIYTSANYGVNWTERRPAGDVDLSWHSCSISGSNMIVTIYDGRLYVSTNYGVDWTEKQPAGNFDKKWHFSCADGTYMIAVIENGRVYVSADNGDNWAEKQPAGNVDKNWKGCSVSGSYMMASVLFGHVYTSANYGVNWVERQPSGDIDEPWRGCSVDGTRMIVGGVDTRLYTSENGGVDWTERQPTGDVDKNWRNCSADGDYMIAGIYNGRIWRLYEESVPDQVLNVQATDGVHTDKVVVTWNAASGADKYYVWNGSGWIDVGDVLTWDHTGAPAPTITHGSITASNGTSTAHVALSNTGASANVGSSISYKVKAWNAAGYGPESASNSGYRGVGSLTYQWYRSAGDSDASYSSISGATASTYNDTAAPAPTITVGTASASDGTSSEYVTLSIAGESTNVGAGRYYKCYHTATGATPGYTGVNRGYRGVGSLTYQWQRSAADSDADYSNIDGGTTDPYNDTGAPEDGSGRYFKCVENATGATQVTTNADRGYRISVAEVNVIFFSTPY